MATDGDDSYCGEHCIMYRSVGWLCCIADTNIGHCMSTML